MHETRQKWHNNIVYRNIYQFTTILEICMDLPVFGYLSLGNSSFSWYLSSIKKFIANLKAIFPKNSSTIKNLSFPNLSIQKVVDSYIFFLNSGRLTYILINSNI